jgi:hypothetical protein
MQFEDPLFHSFKCRLSILIDRNIVFPKPSSDMHQKDKIHLYQNQSMLQCRRHSSGILMMLRGVVDSPGHSFKSSIWLGV